MIFLTKPSALACWVAGAKRRLLAVIALLLFFGSMSYSQLVLNEMMPFNSSTLADQFSEYSDWIEVYNSGSATLTINNYWLSDEISIPKKWNLPDIDLAAGEYMLFFASGRDIRTAVSYWHTIADLGDYWKYYLPGSDIGNAWKSSSSATVGWQSGKSGIGYSDNDDSTIINPTIALYMQYTFNLDNVSEVNNAAFYMDYDDGFIAYLNGTEIARSSNMGSYGESFAFDQGSYAGREAIMYNGNYPETYDVSSFTGLLQTGENVLAIEVHNLGISSSDMSAIPIFLLGFDQVQPQFPAGNKNIIVNSIYPHTNFKIAFGGESIYLSNASGVIIDSISTKYVPEDYSYGRIVSDPSQFGYFEVPTPNAENSPDYALEYVSDSVLLSFTGKEYDSNQQVQLISPKEGDNVYYTTDGSEPTISSPVFNGVININSVQVIRARVIRPNQLPGPITTKTFFTGRKPNITRISISTNPDNLFDFNEGIFEDGPGWTSNDPHYGANYWQDWEKPVNIEIYNTDGLTLLNQGAGAKIYGAWSRAHPQKSMAFFARSAYGDGSFSYQLFPAKEIKKYESFIIRNGGNDFNGSFFRDALTGYLASRMDVDHQAYRPAAVYINGEYWGIMNMREKINEHFIASNNLVHPEDVNILESTGYVVIGSQASYNQMMNFVRTKNLASAVNYNDLKEMMDVDNYIRYWLLQVYIDNRDWPGNNIKFWSTQSPGSKYRWILYDSDFGYALYDNPGYNLNTLTFALGESDGNWANGDAATELMRSLIVNTQFRNSLINQFADRMNTVLQPEYMLNVVDSFQQVIGTEVPYHFMKWGGNVTNWNNQLGKMRNYINQRPDYMTDFIIGRFNLSGTSGLYLEVSDPSAGRVRVNSIVPVSYPFEGIYYKNVPIQLEAIPAPGYIFSHWEGNSTSEDEIIDYDMNSGGSFTAVFADASSAKIDVVINEINYASSPVRNTEDWIELFNNSNVAVNMAGWKIVDNSSGGIFIIPEGNVMPSKSYMVFSRSIPDFKRFYPESGPIVGEMRYGLNSISDGIVLLDASNSIHDEVIYGSTDPWPVDANGTGATLELIRPTLDNSLAQNWKASLDNQGTPNAINSQFVVGIESPSDLFAPAVQVYPTLFTDVTSLRLDSKLRERVNISVISITGSLVEVLENKILSPGEYYYDWIPGSSVQPGMYFIRVSTSSMVQTFKVIYQ